MEYTRWAQQGLEWTIPVHRYDLTPTPAASSSTKPSQSGRKTGGRRKSYRQHVTDVYVAWCGLVRLHGGLIERIAGRCGITPDRLLKSSLLCVVLHDLGKLSANFQRMMHAPTGLRIGPPRSKLPA